MALLLTYWLTSSEDQYANPGLAQDPLLCARVRFRPVWVCPLPFVVLSPTEERRAREWPLETAELPEGHLEDWLEKRAKRLSSAPSIRCRPQGYPSSFLMEVSRANLTMNPHYRPSWRWGPTGRSWVLKPQLEGVALENCLVLWPFF